MRLMDRLLSPATLGGIAVVILAVGYFLQVEMNAQVAAGTRTLDAGGMTVFGVLSKVAGAIGLLALARVVFRVAPEGAEEAPDLVLVDDVDPAPVTEEVRPAVPLWKQRAGLAGGPAIVTEQEAAPVADAVQVQLEEPTGTTFTLRKGLIACVGGLFLLGLVATIVDVIGRSASEAAVAAEEPRPQDQLAAVVADAIVPDAPQDRHWTQIDLTPMAEWVTATGLLAASGDLEAIKTLTLLTLGLLGVLCLPFMFLGLRRAFRPRVSVRMDSMGL